MIHELENTKVIYDLDYTREIFGDSKLDAIFLLGGGDMSRVNAATRLGEIYPDSIIYTMSQNGFPPKMHSKNPHEVNIHADEAEKILLGVGFRSDRLVQLPQSTSTLTELLEIIATLGNSSIETIGIVTNDSHIDRANLILEKLMDPNDSEIIENSLTEYLMKNDSSLITTHNRIWENLKFDRSGVLMTGLSRIKFVSAELLLGEARSQMNIDETKGVQNLLDNRYDFARPSYLSYVRDVRDFYQVTSIS